MINVVHHAARPAKVFKKHGGLRILHASRWTRSKTWPRSTPTPQADRRRRRCTIQATAVHVLSRSRDVGDGPRGSGGANAKPQASQPKKPAAPSRDRPSPVGFHVNFWARQEMEDDESGNPDSTLRLSLILKELTDQIDRDLIHSPPCERNAFRGETTKR